VFNVLLQVLDDGRLTDGQGRTVDFRNTVIILTSNLGTEFLSAEDGGDSKSARAQAMAAVRAHFRPEFLNRLDDIILFHRLTRANMDKIVHIQIGRLDKLLADRKIEIALDKKATDWLGNAGYDPVYGARPLKRVIQRRLQDPLAQLILEGKIADGAKVKVSASKTGLTIDGKEFAANADELADAIPEGVALN
jgi:ATP-dependent Clp protease ATP-binding subunit ClpB